MKVSDEATTNQERRWQPNPCQMTFGDAFHVNARWKQEAEGSKWESGNETNIPLSPTKLHHCPLPISITNDLKQQKQVMKQTLQWSPVTGCTVSCMCWPILIFSESSFARYPKMLSMSWGICAWVSVGGLCTWRGRTARCAHKLCGPMPPQRTGLCPSPQTFLALVHRFIIRLKAENESVKQELLEASRKTARKKDESMKYARPHPSLLTSREVGISIAV